MKLTPNELAEAYEAGRLKIALLGMSNIGKSHLARRLEHKFGFKNIEVDAFIQARLGKNNMDDHAAWLGQPYSDGYAAREHEAIRLETEATSEAMDICLTSENAVLDAPGSVIYIDKPTLKRLKRHFLCVYLKADDADIDRLKQLYFSQPKPLIWNNNYQSSLAENPDDAIMKSYEYLLHQRAQTYTELADITLPAQQLFSEDFDLGSALGLTG